MVNRVIKFFIFRIEVIIPFLKSLYIYLYINLFGNFGTDLKNFSTTQIKYLFFCLIGVMEKKRIIIESQFREQQEEIFLSQISNFRNKDNIAIGELFFIK